MQKSKWGEEAFIEDRHAFSGLDVLRGCAALCVVFFHVGQIFDIRWAMPSGYIAVDLFFLMSGVVIANAYEQRIPILGVGGFMSIRVIRFYPLYILGMLIGLMRAILLLMSERPIVEAQDLLPILVSGMFFLPSMTSGGFTNAISPLNGAAWSLIVEFWINLVYAILLKWLSNVVLIGITLLSAIGMMYFYYNNLPGGGAFIQTIHVGFIRGIYSFTVGVLIFRFRHLVWAKSVPIIIPAAVCVFLFMLPQSNVEAAVTALILSPAIVIFSLNSSAPSHLSIYLGTTSYCIYAIHTPILQMTGGAARRLGVPDTLAAFGPVLVILIAAPFLDRRFDRPARKRLSALIEMCRPAHAAQDVPTK